MEQDNLESSSQNPDQLPFIEQESEAHPSPEMTLIRMAIDKALMRGQKELWYMYAYDKMLPAEIATKLKTSKANISQRIKVIEKLIAKYCKDHMESYKALKEAEIESNDL